MVRCCLVFNEKSGAASRGDLVRRSMPAHSPMIPTCADESKFRQSLEQAFDAGVRRVIVAGGDGTVHRLINCVTPRVGPIEMAIIPLGTGNDLARSLGLPLDDDDYAIRLALTGAAQPIDVVRVDDGSVSYFVNGATAGFGGQVAVDTTPEVKATWGPFAYWMTAISELAQLTEYDVQLHFDHHRIRTKTYGLAVANGRYVGGGFPIAPFAWVDDGLLDVTLIPVLPPLELLAAGLNYILGELTGGGRLKTFRSRSVRIVSRPDMMYSMDGDPVREVDARFEVLPSALNMVPGPFPVALQASPRSLFSPVDAATQARFESPSRLPTGDRYGTSTERP